MKSLVIESLKQHLNAISDEEFAAQWAEIKALGIEGPSVAEYFGLRKKEPSIEMTSRILVQSPFVQGPIIQGDYNYSHAA